MPPSRRSSSRKSRSSARKSKSTKNTNSTIANNISVQSTDKDNKTKYSLFGFMFSLIIQGLIIYYLYNLESKDCNCIRDWRHNYIKYFAIFIIIFNAFNFTFVNMPKAAMSLGVLLILLQLVNIYAFFTYVGELNETKCKCAVDKQPVLNSFMNALRWFQVVAVIIVILMIIFFVLFMRSLFTKAISS